VKKRTRKNIRKDLWDICKVLIRQRDKNICQMCGKYVEGSNCHTSHVIPVSFSLRLAYDLVNLKVLCYHCHLHIWHKNPLLSTAWFRRKFPSRYKYLQKRKKEIHKLGSVKTFELEEWLKELKDGQD